MVSHVLRRLMRSTVLGRVGLTASIAACLVDSLPATAQITPDDTLGEERSVVLEEVAPGVDGIAGGAARGSNLFHSFQRFNVGEGRSAYFANPDGIRNIVGRVTGNDPSSILGTLGVLGEANLFLINPNGIVFGPNASLDVQGSFVATTANALQFGEQGFFSATAPETPALLTVNPSALLFNQVPTGSITNLSRAPVGTEPFRDSELGLRVPDGENLLLVGGDIVMDGGRVNAPGGRIELAGLAAPGAIGLNIGETAFELTVPGNTPLADITLVNDGQASVLGTGGGDLIVNADQFNGISGGRLVAGTRGSGDGGTVRINANAITLSGTGANDIGGGILTQAADVRINTGSLSLQNNAFILTTNILAQGPPGAIQINARESVSLNGGSNLAVNGTGNDGITINTPTLTVQNSSNVGVFSTDLAGQNGDIAISAPGFITVSNNSQIVNNASYTLDTPIDRVRTNTSGNIAIQTNALTVAQNSVISSTSVFTAGRAGDLTIQAGDVLIRDDSAIAAAAVGGSGGNITITAERFLGQRGGSIITNALSPINFTPTATPGLVLDETSLAGRDQFVAAATQSGNLDAIGRGSSGNITVRATGAVELDGLAADGSRSLISTGSDAGDAGDVTLAAQTLGIRNGAFIASTTNANGQGGDLNLTANAIEITGSTPIVPSGAQTRFSSSVETSTGVGAAGNAGSLNIQTDRLLIGGGARVDTSTNGLGRGGDIQIAARESIDLVGASDVQAPQQQSLLSSSSNSAGNAGNISINTPRLRLQNGGVIAANAGGTGRGGNIAITADRINFSGMTVDGQGVNAITSLSSGTETGNAGDITISTGSLRVRDGFITASTLGAGQGGTIRIAARNDVDVIGTVGINGEQFSSSITTGASAAGDAGNIQITADRLRLQDGGLVSAETFGLGQGGTLTIRAEAIEVVGTFLSPDPDESTPRSGLRTDTFGAGNAGDIFLFADRLRIRNGGLIAANTDGTGAGGNIAITADEIEISGLPANRATISAISSTSRTRNASGNAGIIAITTDRLTLRDGGQIAALTLGGGQGGSLLITARDTIDIAGRVRLADGLNLPSGLRTDTGGIGRAGDITLFTDRLQLGNRGTISASSAGVGTGGTIRLFAGDLSLAGGAVISAQSRNIGQAGNIDVQVGDQVSLTNSRIITAANRSSGGSISVRAGDIRLQSSNIQTNVNEGRETGGNITLTAGSIVAFDDSNILAFARDGRGGNITLDTPVFLGEGYVPEENIPLDQVEGNGRVDVNASGSLESGVIRVPDVTFIQNSLAEIPDETIDPDQLIANSCIARNTSSGTFVITGSGGLPERPGDGGESTYPTGEVQSVPQEQSTNEATPARQGGEVIEEPQGVFQLPDGQLVMSRFCDR